MKLLLAIPIALLTACTNAQTPPALPTAASLLTTHFGAKPSGSPLGITWKPQGADAQQVGYLEHGTVRTTVDTILYPEPDLALVFFRTAPTRGDEVPGSMCTLCEDQLGLAIYKRISAEWTLVKFEKWFAKQGVYDRVAKPEMVVAGKKGKVVRVISSDGEPEHNSTTHRLFGVPGLREAFTLTTDGIEVERGGDHGPVDETVSREYRFIPSDKEWFDVEIVEDGAKPTRWTYSAATGKYVGTK